MDNTCQTAYMDIIRRENGSPLGYQEKKETKIFCFSGKKKKEKNDASLYEPSTEVEWRPHATRLTI